MFVHVRSRISWACGIACLVLPFAFASCLCASQVRDQNAALRQLDSPDGQVHLELRLQPLSYSVSYHGRPVLTDSALNLDFKGQGPFGTVKLVSARQSSVNTGWKPVWGKVAEIRNNYKELDVELVEVNAPNRRVDLSLRAYDDGVAFRYKLPQQPDLDHFILARELTEFHFAGDPTVWASSYKNFHHAYEEEYPKQRLSAVASSALLGLPLLAQVDGKTYAAIAEADLTDWAGMYLKHSGSSLSAALSPRLDGDGLVKAETPHSSPWRVVMLASQPGDLIESNLIQNLSQPSAIRDTSWIQPGMMAWDEWWSGDVKMDTATNKRFIAFAGEMKFPYQLIDWQWYGPYNTPEANITQPAPQLDLPELIRFAKERNVREWLWIHSGDVDRYLKAGKLDSAFATYEKWGIAGVKIDFMDSDDQDRVDWYQTIVEMAAKHHLMVDFHGAYKPTGLSRTWPNLLTREGVLGNEYNKFSNRATSVHRLTLPFTRMLVGPMDYTPGGFLNRGPHEWKQTTPTEVLGSRAQELALFVVYWSPLTCVADDPEHYRDQPGLDFLRVVPTVWDDTKVLDGSVGQHIVVARRHGQSWFVGGMTADQAYRFHMPLAFLGSGTYIAHIYADPTDASANYEALQESTRRVRSTDALDLQMRVAGGVAVYFESANESKQTKPAVN